MVKSFRPELPPKAGYVEVEVNGVRTYKNATTGVLIEDEQALPDPLEQLQAEYDALILDQAFRLTLLELGVN